jgi:hypothetical protein
MVSIETTSTAISMVAESTAVRLDVGSEENINII